MIQDYVELAKEYSADIAATRKALPEAMKGFAALAAAATQGGALDPKTKELMALAIGIAAHCDGCIALHLKAARRLGASREEIAETIAMAIYMGAGPSMIYGTHALKAFDQMTAAEG